MYRLISLWKFKSPWHSCLLHVTVLRNAFFPISPMKMAVSRRFQHAQQLVVFPHFIPKLIIVQPPPNYCKLKFKLKLSFMPLNRSSFFYCLCLHQVFIRKFRAINIPTKVFAKIGLFLKNNDFELFLYSHTNFLSLD